MRKGAQIVMVLMMMAAPVWAKPSPELVAALRAVFVPAEFHKGAASAQAPLDMTKVRGFAVIKKAGIPASQAYWFISRQDYEFRPLIIEEGTTAKTHFGKVDLTLEPGTIMVVVDANVQGQAASVKLLSRDVLAEKGGNPTLHDTRAGTALVFKFPQLQMTVADAPVIISKIEDYVVPAESLTQAQQIAMQVTNGHPPVTAPAPSAVWAAAPAKATPPPVAASAPIPATAVPAPVSNGVVHTGMTFEQVKHIKGEPKRIITRGGTVTYDYGEHDVIFVQGKVSDIRWK